MRRAEDPNRGLGSGGMAEWKEGALFPEGWDRMDLPKKVMQQIPQPAMAPVPSASESRHMWNRLGLLLLFCPQDKAASSFISCNAGP